MAKVNATGTGLVYAGFIGGDDRDSSGEIAVDVSGNAYVTGTTWSTEATFPDRLGPDRTFNGNYDAFVAKVNATGTALVYAGYIGGTGGDVGQAIAIDDSGNPHITGQTTSTQASFPETDGPDITFNGFTDAFVAKLAASGTDLLYAGYLGGTSGEETLDIALDGSGNAYVVGYTASTDASFPDTVGPDTTYNGGSSDAFVAKIAGDCTITGTSENDTLDGTAYGDAICLREGDDVSRGRGGNDHLAGSGGRDDLTGGAGHDLLAGGNGDDTLHAEDGARGDVVIGGANGAGGDVCAVDAGDVVRGCETVA